MAGYPELSVMDWNVWQNDTLSYKSHSRNSLLAHNIHHYHNADSPLYIIFNKPDVHHECNNFVSTECVICCGTIKLTKY